MPAAAQLREKLRFEARSAAVDDGYGNFVAGWEERFTADARVMPLKGSESVIASRLAGVQPVIITIRSHWGARQVTSDWRAVDTRNTSRVFNIKSLANFDERNRYLDIMAEAGVPT
jgi:head-tail adaptor